MIASLKLSGCSSLTFSSLSVLSSYAALKQTTELKLSHLHALERPDAATWQQLEAMFRSTEHRLAVLHMDGACVDNQLLVNLAESCRKLTELSIVGCLGLTDVGLQALAAGLKLLRKLSVGGAKGTWTEQGGLSAFKDLDSLAIARRNCCSDDDLISVLSQHPSLRSIRLAGLASITDRGLAALPMELAEATFVCCDGMCGASLSRLEKLQELRMRDCVRISPQAMQVTTFFFKLQPQTVQPPAHYYGM